MRCEEVNHEPTTVLFEVLAPSAAGVVGSRHHHQAAKFDRMFDHTVQLLFTVQSLPNLTRPFQRLLRLEHIVGQTGPQSRQDEDYKGSAAKIESRKTAN